MIQSSQTAPDSAGATAGQGPSEQELVAAMDELVPVEATAPRSPGGEPVNLIGLLQQVQERFGYLPPAAIREIGRRTRIPLSRIYGVVSFYAQFHTEPRGRHTILCCRGTACHVRSGERVLDMLRDILGIDEGQSTEDLLFYLESVACLGTCFLAPVMMIDSQYYGTLAPSRIEKILNSYRVKT